MKSANDQHDFPRAAISRLLAERLQSTLSAEDRSSAEHLDADTTAAFVEGRLDDKEARPIISHVINCASCLHLTAELIRFEAETDEVSDATLADETAGPLRRFFDRFADGAFPQFNEDTVFAYNENENGEKTEPEDTEES
jgi:hypothetical protein